MCLRQPFGSAITALAQTHWHADLFDWMSAKFGDDNNVNWRQPGNALSKALGQFAHLGREYMIGNAEVTLLDDMSAFRSLEIRTFVPAQPPPSLR
jgi:hypothetical protein